VSSLDASLDTVTLWRPTGQGGWANALPQMPVEQFITEVEAGTFNFTWE
jgi:hypothetical protein